jgi:RNA polymerase sigma-70 factor (ECF subfamily)
MDARFVPRFASDLPADEESLARYAVAADPRAATALYDRYATLVRGLLGRMLGPHADVDDLVQDTFMGIHRTLPGLRDPRMLRSFVVGTALRLARSELRRRRVRRVLLLTSTAALSERPDPGASDPEARRAVRRFYAILDGLEVRSRMAFVLRHVEGCELVEVAAAMRCSIASTKRLLARTEALVRARAERDALLAGYVSDGQHRPPAAHHDPVTGYSVVNVQ